MIIYCIPFCYMLKTRYKTVFYKMGFCIIYLIPILLGLFFYEKNTTILILSIMGINLLYEIGYLDNDIITSHYEKSPTKRLPDPTLKWISRHILILTALRLALFIFIGIYIVGFSILRGKLYFINGAFLILIYALHNTIRSKWNIVTFIFLLVSKYFSPLIIGFKHPIDAVLIFICIFLVICIPRIFEYASKISLIKKEYFLYPEKIRLIYEGIVLSFSSLCSFALNKINYLLLLSIYYFSFRLLCFVLGKIKEELRDTEKKI